jgi:hypothetical protein
MGKKVMKNAPVKKFQIKKASKAVKSDKNKPVPRKTAPK